MKTVDVEEVKIGWQCNICGEWVSNYPEAAFEIVLGDKSAITTLIGHPVCIRKIRDDQEERDDYIKEIEELTGMKVFLV